MTYYEVVSESKIKTNEALNHVGDNATNQCVYQISILHFSPQQIHIINTVIMKSAALVLLLSSAHGFSFVPQASSRTFTKTHPSVSSYSTPTHKASSSLSMVDNNILLGGAVAVGGLAVGIGLVAFAENMGERGKSRGGGLSSDMATKLSGALLEDVEVDSVSDLSSLTEKLEAALKESGGADEKELEMSEEDKKRIAEEADDGW